MRRTASLPICLATALALACGLHIGAAHAQQLTCELEYESSGGGFFVKRTSGTGVIQCSNGQRLQVDITSRGGGLTFGHARISDGHGEFTPVSHIRELLGSYTEAEVSAGGSSTANKSQIMKKGPVRLKLRGRGSGRTLGIAFGRFHITERGQELPEEELILPQDE